MNQFRLKGTHRKCDTKTQTNKKMFTNTSVLSSKQVKLLLINNYSFIYIDAILSRVDTNSLTTMRKRLVSCA